MRKAIIISVCLLISLFCSAEEKVFLKRVGNDLYMGGKPFRIIAVNKFDLFLRFLAGGEEKQQAIKAIEEASKEGFRVIRFSGVGYYPRDMRHWARENIYWQAFDELVETSKRNGVYLIPTLNWNIYLFPDMAGECVQDMLKNPDSRSRQYLWLYTYQIVSRYKDDPTILFWELTNEMNLSADLAFMNPYGFSNGNWVELGTSFMRLRRDHFTTDEMIPFIREWAQFIKSLDKNHLIGSGFSIPRASAQHLRLAKGKGDWTQDSVEEFEVYLRDVHPDPVDLISIHFYPRDGNLRFGNKDENSAEVLEIVKKVADRIGKPIYIGETGDDYGKNPSSVFLRNVFREVVKLNIPITLVWNWMSPNDAYDVSPERTPAIVSMMKEANELFSK
ncbi:MAG: cellulase family glycosylhydrolase [bacterium]